MDGTQTPDMSIDCEDSVRLFDAVHSFLRRYVAYPFPHAAVAHTLWIGHTHVMNAWSATPRLAFLSPEPESGKSRALEITELLVPRPLNSFSVTAAYLFRSVAAEAGLPTILYDEVDAVFGPKARDHEDLRALLNSGHRRHAKVGRCEVRGNTIVQKEWPVYSAVALAGLGALPDTLLSRSIVIPMRRRSPDEHVLPFRARDCQSEGDWFRMQLADWAELVEDELAFARPCLPPGVQDRAADCWEPLLAVADAIGGHWPELARDAASAMVAEARQHPPSLGLRLLLDLRKVFADEGYPDALATKTIIEELCGLDESPWAELGGKPITSSVLADLLKPYGISPKVIRFEGIGARGYERAPLSDAWQRYLPPMHEDDVTPVTAEVLDLQDWQAQAGTHVNLNACVPSPGKGQPIGTSKPVTAVTPSTDDGHQECAAAFDMLITEYESADEIDTFDLVDVVAREGLPLVELWPALARRNFLHAGGGIYRRPTLTNADLLREEPPAAPPK